MDRLIRIENGEEKEYYGVGYVNEVVGRQSQEGFYRGFSHGLKINLVMFVDKQGIPILPSGKTMKELEEKCQKAIFKEMIYPYRK